MNPLAFPIGPTELIILLVLVLPVILVVVVLVVVKASRSSDKKNQVAPPANTFGPGSGPAPSAAQELERLAALHQQGALSDEEFAAAKARILG